MSEPLTAFIPSKTDCKKQILLFVFRFVWDLDCTCAYWSTVAPGWISIGPWGTILGACQPPTSAHSITSMWSVKAVPNWRPSSAGFAFLFFTSSTSTTTLWRWTCETNQRSIINVDKLHLGRGRTQTSESPWKELHRHDVITKYLSKVEVQYFSKRDWICLQLLSYLFPCKIEQDNNTDLFNFIQQLYL